MKIKTADGEREIRAIRRVGKYLAIHRPASGRGAWTVTHVPTGKAVLSNLPETIPLKDLQKAVEKMSTSADWSFSDVGDITDKNNFRRAINSVVSEMRKFTPGRVNEKVSKYQIGGTNEVSEFRQMSFGEAANLLTGNRIWFLANDGKARQVKVNGEVKRWKRDRSRIVIPARYGMYEYAKFGTEDGCEPLSRLLIRVGS